MADQIEINIYLRDGEASPKSEDTVTGSGSNIPGMSQAGTDVSKENKAIGALGKYVASQTVSVFLGNVKSAISSNIGLKTGKTELQERINFGMEIAQQGVNTFKNAMAGKILATSAGFSGGAGAVLGVALSAISYGINTAFKQQQLNIQENIENRQINQTLSRYGAGYNKSRSGL